MIYFILKNNFPEIPKIKDFSKVLLNIHDHTIIEYIKVKDTDKQKCKDYDYLTSTTTEFLKILIGEFNDGNIIDYIFNIKESDDNEPNYDDNLTFNSDNSYANKQPVLIIYEEDNSIHPDKTDKIFVSKVPIQIQNIVNKYNNDFPNQYNEVRLITFINNEWKTNAIPDNLYKIIKTNNNIFLNDLPIYEKKKSNKIILLQELINDHFQKINDLIN